MEKNCGFEENTFFKVTHESLMQDNDERNMNGKCKDFKIKFVSLSLEKSRIGIDSSHVLRDKACGQCSMTFKYKRHLDRHLEGHQKNNCSHCNAKFARRKHLETHLFRSHGERVTKYSHSCDVCPRSFPKRGLLNRHRAKHDYQNGKVCSDCGEMLNTEVDDKEHKENHCTRKQFKCKKCLQTFSIQQTYLTHIQNHDNHKCIECNVRFASKKTAQEHYKSVHSRRLNCTKIINHSSYSFPKQDDFYRHVESKPHLCKISKDSSTSLAFTCSICTKKLISRRALDQHIRRTHKGEKKFICNIYSCTFQCARRTDLDRHKQLHVEERNIICEHCGKTFTSVSILNDHVLYLHNKERQFVCEECGKAFKRNSLLKRHKLSHQQHRPFSCMQCSTAFKRSHHLTRHMEACHRIILEKKKKVVKFMKAEDGRLVPVPENPKKIFDKPNKLTAEQNANLGLESGENRQPSIGEDANVEFLNADTELQSLPASDSTAGNLNIELAFVHLLPIADRSPQVVSLVNVHSGGIVSAQVTSAEALVMSNLVNQSEVHCNEMLNFSEFQDELLDAESCEEGNYSELSLNNTEETSVLLDSDSNKTDTLPTLENYLTQPFPTFLNL